MSVRRLLEPPPPPNRLRRLLLLGGVAAVVAGLLLWHAFRFHREENTVRRFLDTLAAGQYEQAYRLWHPQPSYSFSDFMQDWGPEGFYGPVRSYRIEQIRQPRNGSGVIVTVLVSPYRPFPDRDPARARYNKPVRLWVERADQSLSFAP